jgi:hypothetical protein
LCLCLLARDFLSSVRGAVDKTLCWQLGEETSIQ